MKTLEEQIANRCIYFTSIADSKCMKGIEYDEVKDRTAKPYKFPCLRQSTLHGGECLDSKFPTKEEVKHHVAEIQEMSKHSLNIFKLIRDYFMKAGNREGAVQCPKCKGDLNFNVSKFNDHIQIKCSNCDMYIVQ